VRSILSLKYIPERTIEKVKARLAREEPRAPV